MNLLLKSRIQNSISNFMLSSNLSLENLPETELSFLLADAKKISLRRKEILFREGEPPKGIYMITRGKIKISQLNYNGAVQILFIYTHGELFGHRTIMGNDRQPVTATALEDCELLFIEKEQFLHAIKSSPLLAELFMKSMSHEFSVLLNRINVFAQRAIRERLALFLLILNETYKTPNQIIEESEIHMNRNDLAAYTGTSVENLVRTLKTFRESGYVRMEGKSIFIQDFEALHSISGS